MPPTTSRGAGASGSAACGVAAGGVQGGDGRFDRRGWGLVDRRLRHGFRPADRRGHEGAVGQARGRVVLARRGATGRRSVAVGADQRGEHGGGGDHRELQRDFGLSWCAVSTHRLLSLEYPSGLRVYGAQSIRARNVSVSVNELSGTDTALWVPPGSAATVVGRCVSTCGFLVRSPAATPSRRIGRHFPRKYLVAIEIDHAG